MTINTILPEISRVVDANLNRLREGIRVVEDILRYKDNNKHLASKLKTLRHLARINETLNMLSFRDSNNDVMRSSIKSELNRKNLENIIIANFKRAQESARVLEELFKLNNQTYSENFKYIRYELYQIEKDVFNLSE